MSSTSKKSRGPRRPSPMSVGPVKARVIRGPRPDGAWYWQAVVYRDATERTVWTGWGTSEEATRQIAARVAADSLDAPRERPVDIATVRDLLECWNAAQEARQDLTVGGKRTYRNRSRHVVGAIGEVRLDRIDATTVERYRDARLKAGGATATVKKELTVLTFAWRWGREIGACPARDLPRPKIKVVPVRNRRTPTIEDVVSVLEQLDGWPWLAVRLLFATGARIGEIATLRWGAVDLDRQEVTLRGKTGERTVPVAGEIVDLLRERAGAAGDPVLGVSPLVVRGHLCTRWIAAACARAGVPRFTPHGLRRAAVDALLRAGVDVGTAASLLGHSPAVMLAAYRQATADDRRRAIAASRLGVLPAAKVVAFPGARASGGEGALS